MKLNNNFSNYQTIDYCASFKAVSRDVCDSDGKLCYRNDTSLFRPDLNCAKFADYLHNKFINTDKVNLYSLSSSSGDEPYSLVMTLLEKYGEEGSKKFFPVLASDCDEKMIAMADKGFLPMYEEEVALINRETNGKFNEYFEILDVVPDFIQNMDMDFDFIAKVKPVLRDKVIFSAGDAAQMCLRVKPDNSVVMARNFWPYLKDESKRVKLANDLYCSLGKNSAVVIGKYDDEWGSFASKNLQDAGFVCHQSLFNIFEKNKIPVSCYRQIG